MFLKGQIISLRALEPSDVDILYEWENDQNLWHVSYTQTPFSKFILEEFVNTAFNDIYTNKQLRLMIVDTNLNKTIGAIDLFEFDPQHDRCGVGIYIIEQHRKSGLAFECIELLKQYCFNNLHLKQLYVHISQFNMASLALFEKAGFENSGLKKCWRKTGINEYEDVYFLQFINKSD